MTVAELLEELRTVDPSRLVLVEGYEYGYSTPTLTLRRVGLHVNPGATVGGLYDDIEGQSLSIEAADALIFERQSAIQEEES